MPETKRMNLLNLSINHRTAPLEIREKVWLSEEEIRAGVQRLHEKYFGECMLFSTCNRTEIFGVGAGAEATPASVRDFLLSLKQVGTTIKPDHFIVSSSEDAVYHLFRVAAGIDSMVIGDIQIL